VRVKIIREIYSPHNPQKEKKIKNLKEYRGENVPQWGGAPL